MAGRMASRGEETRGPAGRRAQGLRISDIAPTILTNVYSLLQFAAGLGKGLALLSTPQRPSASGAGTAHGDGSTLSLGNDAMCSVVPSAELVSHRQHKI